jgi:hypothetical protein
MLVFVGQKEEIAVEEEESNPGCKNEKIDDEKG